jgi:hypothetical protein
MKFTPQHSHQQVVYLPKQWGKRCQGVNTALLAARDLKKSAETLAVSALVQAGCGT